LSVVTTFSIIELSQKLVKKGISGQFIYQLKTFLQELALLNLLKHVFLYVRKTKIF